MMPADSLLPHAQDIDVHGATHPGRVRSVNEDQYLIASMHKLLRVHGSSASPEALGDLTSESRGYLFLVADGVGGAPDGELASWTAVRAIAEHVTHVMRFYAIREGKAREALFLEELQASVAAGHARVREEAAGTATTLTMVVVLWPRAYLIHVGDSRCYRLRDGELQLLSQDQTMAEALVAAGALTPEAAAASEWKHVLASALGGDEATPLTVPTDCHWNDVLLLCTDGLTKHVTDHEIGEVLRSGGSAEQMTSELLARALADGDSDNITAVVGKLRARETD
jgi:protein phosphatase